MKKTNLVHPNATPRDNCYATFSGACKLPLRKVLGKISPDHFTDPLSDMISDALNGLSDTYRDIDFRIWLAEFVSDDRHFFYLANAGQHSSENPIITDAIDVNPLDNQDFASKLSAVLKLKNSIFVPIQGTRFGQRSDNEFLKPKHSLVGAVEASGKIDPSKLRPICSMLSYLIWSHRSSRFLTLENEIAQALSSADGEQPDWSLVSDKICEYTFSNNFGVFTLNQGNMIPRFNIDYLINSADFYISQIIENQCSLDNASWIRSTPNQPVEGGVHGIFYMVIPLSTAHYRHENNFLRPLERIQHYAVLETDNRGEQKERSMYSSADRRMVDHGLSRYLRGIAETRIDQQVTKILSHLPVYFPEDPIPDIKKIIKEVASVVYDVEDVCIITPTHITSDAPDNDAVISASENVYTFSLEFINSLSKIEASPMEAISDDFVKIVRYEGMSGIVFYIGNAMLRRFIIFFFSDKYSSYVSTEICSRVANKLEIFWQSCDLQSDRTSSLTEIAHVLRGPVSSALEDLRSVLRDRRSGVRSAFKTVGARSEDEILSDVVASLSRARSITDSAKHLLGELSQGKFQRRKVSFLPILAEVRASLEVQRSRKKTVINFVDNSAKDKNGQIYVWGDDDLLWLLIYNLLENAIKYGRRYEDIRINLNNRRSDGGNFLTFAISNYGDLIWDHDIERIFLPYQRALSGLAMNGVQGTGIGLPAADQIARAFNPDGGIRIEQSDVRSATQRSGTIRFAFDLARAE